MGLFDFIKDIGHNKDKEADSTKIQQDLMATVTKAGLSIQNFQIKYDNGLATLSGVALTQKDLEMARLIIGNHRGVDKVNDDGLRVASYAAGHSVPDRPLVLNPNAAQAPAQTNVEAPAMMVTVRKGDTLSKIAQEHLGNANLYQAIFEANRPMLKDPDEIFPGQVLRIPQELKMQSQVGMKHAGQGQYQGQNPSSSQAPM